MRRRLVSSHLKTLANSSSSTTFRSVAKPSSLSSRPTTSSVISRYFSTASENVAAKPKMRVEDVLPIATGHEREELAAELEGRDLLEINYPVGPFGTKENPAIVKSYYGKRIVGCPGAEEEDEHDVFWCWLKKDQPSECPVCTQYFKLEVVGPGGDPEGHDDDEYH